VQEKVSIISSLELLSTPNKSISPDSDTTLHIKVQALVQALVRLILPNKDHSTTTSASMAVDSKFLTIGFCEATPLDQDSEEFKRLHRYFYQSHPGRTEANDLPEAGHTDVAIEDIFRISRTEEMAEFGDVDMRNGKDSRRRLWHGSRSSNIAGKVCTISSLELDGASCLHGNPCINVTNYMPRRAFFVARSFSAGRTQGPHPFPGRLRLLFCLEGS
jgi:hypothetical protein